MTAEFTAGAASHKEAAWYAIDWQTAQENVRRLQARIVKATQEGRWGKVKALQRLLTRSFSGKALAVKRVTENDGKKTPGVDGELWNTPEKKAEAVHALKQHGYKPQPLRRVYIPKSNGKKRPLGIPTMKDRAMQALYLLALDPIAETNADPNSYGFRKDRSCADAIGQCFNLLAQGTAAQWILEGDIKSCFDRISHEWMLAHLPTEKAILQKWLKSGYMENRMFHLTQEGTPQGGIISPVLANMVLDGLEARIREKYPRSCYRTGRQYKVNLVRYADDFIITGKSKELLETEVKPLVEQFLKERGLELSEEKTRITHIDEGFDFLGQNVRKYNGKLLIKPSKKNVKTFLTKVRTVIKKNKTVPSSLLIAMLNPIIRGWANYHRHVVSKKIFDRVDHELCLSLWRWAKRRHSDKNAKWVKAHYFGTVGGNNWRFFGTKQNREGEEFTVYLTRAASIPIRRHVKIRSEANPYDPQWETYYEQRLGLKMVGDLRGRRMLSYLWRSQKGLCPVCQQKITLVTGWHSHHKVWRSLGGSDGLENRVLLHPICHSQLHDHSFSEAQPRPLSEGVREA